MPTLCEKKRMGKERPGALLAPGARALQEGKGRIDQAALFHHAGEEVGQEVKTATALQLFHA